MNNVTRVLIANRGEIAARIVRTVRRMGLRSIVVYSDADGETLAVKMADEAYRLGPAQASDSYLNPEKVLSLAVKTRANAIHPGYGFLSENTDFARLVQKQGIVWIGPSPETMDLVASKSGAKDLAQKNGVPVLPGFQGEQSLEKFKTHAEKIGYPVFLKAAAGGGGRGIRRVDTSEHMAQAFSQAKLEALNGFANDELILEKFIDQAYHIEVQVFGDSKGGAVHLGERDCSVQRRYQKLIEETPSASLTSQLREEITAAAVKMAKACRYENAGTVEFLVTPQGQFYFLEINTRLQVEHPVTELVTGLDLVEWQIRVARGEVLPLKQDEIRIQGHAIQARLYAEDPYQGFRPQTGRIEEFSFPHGIRVDHYLTSRSEVSPFYDSMLAKVIVKAESRALAIKSLGSALEETLISGLITNQTYLTHILESEKFGKHEWLTETLNHLEITKPVAQQRDLALVLSALAKYSESNLAYRSRFSGWSNGFERNSLFAFKTDRAQIFLSVSESAGGTVRITSASFESAFTFSNVKWSRPKLSASLDGKPVESVIHILDDSIEVLVHGETHRFGDQLSIRKQAGSSRDANAVCAPMAGTVTRLFVENGAAVRSGDLMAVVEAMKMQFELKAPRDGKIAAVSVKLGSQVSNKQILFELAPLS
jgi:acetyl/propionyl-CoA carboxylase alpha subunit